MKKQLVIIMLAMAAAWFWAAGGIAELSPQETDDSELIKQAIQLRESKPELFNGAKGILIVKVVKDGQGEKKGLRRGDIVISYAGQQINSAEQLINTVKSNSSKKEVELQFIRAGVTKTVVLQGGQIGIHITDIKDIKTEITPPELIKQFVDAFHKRDLERIKQLVMQNPEATKMVQEVLQKVGQRKDEYGKTAEAIGNMLARELHVMHVMQKADADVLNSAEIDYLEIDYLQETGYAEKAYSAARYEEAIAHWTKALEFAKKAENKKAILDAILNIGMVYQDIGQYDKALSYYKQSLTIHSKDTRVFMHIGNVFLYRGQCGDALGCYEIAMAFNKKISNISGDDDLIGNIGLAYKCLGQYDKALSHHKQALSIHKNNRHRRSEGADLTNIGLVYSDLGQYEKAEIFFSQSMKIFSDIGAPDALWVAQRGLAQAQGKLEKYDEAVKNYEQSLDMIEKVREGISEKEIRTSFMQDKIGVYDEFITLLKKLHEKDPTKGYDKRSFEIFERKQGRVFLEQMGESGSRNFEGFPDEMRDKESELVNRLDKTRSRLTDARSKSFEQQDKKLIQELETEIENISKEQIALQESIRKDYPDYYALKYPKPVKLEDLQNTVLQDGEALLVYNVMEESTCLWIVGKDRFGFFPLGIGEKALEEKVNKFRKEPEVILRAMNQKAKEIISQKNFEAEVETSLKEIRKIGQELYDLLIPEKARPLISGAKLLYVVPTASLYGLPFEALGSGERYLLEDHAVAYLSSASLLKILRDAQSRRKEKPANPLLAFAHPKYGAKENKCFSLTKGGDTADISLDQMRVRSYLDLMGEKLCELPETEKEVRGIGKLLNAPEAAFQLQEKASESNVFKFYQEKKLDDYRYVVFSCHGLLPNEKKTSLVNQPALALSVPDPTDKDRDGFLTMAETFGLKFNADLVVLSACDTGRGDHIRGEGVRGLTRAFMYAGTPAVSVTLWPVADKSSSILSSGFFENRENKKMSLGESLRQIKLDMIQGKHGKIYRHPYFWSPMVVFGIGSEK